MVTILTYNKYVIEDQLLIKSTQLEVKNHEAQYLVHLIIYYLNH